MKTSSKGLQIIKDFEGFGPTMYKDQAGLPTIGYGTLIDTKQEEYLLHATITEKEAEDLLKLDVEHTEDAMNKMTQSVKLNQNQFDSLISFVYNIGTGNFRKSQILKLILLNPNDPNIKTQFGRWKYADGKISDGLISRRKAESELYFSPAKVEEPKAPLFRPSSLYDWAKAMLPKK